MRISILSGMKTLAAKLPPTPAKFSDSSIPEVANAVPRLFFTPVTTNNNSRCYLLSFYDVSGTILDGYIMLILPLNL